LILQDLEVVQGGASGDQASSSAAAAAARGSAESTATFDPGALPVRWRSSASSCLSVKRWALSRQYSPGAEALEGDAVSSHVGNVAQLTRSAPCC